MKHLKDFNEGFTTDDTEKELLYFTKSYLSDLVDNGFNINTSSLVKRSSRNSQFALAATACPNRDYREYSIAIYTGNKLYRWEDMKDSIIPFLQILNNKANIFNISFKGRTHYSYSSSYESVIDDSFYEQMLKVINYSDDRNSSLSSITINIMDINIEGIEII